MVVLRNLLLSLHLSPFSFFPGMCPSPFPRFCSYESISLTFLFLSLQRGSHPWRRLTRIPTTPASLRSSSLVTREFSVSNLIFVVLYSTMSCTIMPSFP
uniref:Secreted protein n=1 Tax=Solanum tuberosum TaxID=4113 RepID=M1CN60_SOLTU